MTHYYTPYTLAQMKKDTSLPAKIQERIQHLVDVYALKITARNDGETFVAYSGSVALTYKAVLLVDIFPGGSNGMAVAIEIDQRPKDYLAKVAEICTKFSYMLKDK